METWGAFATEPMARWLQAEADDNRRAEHKERGSKKYWVAPQPTAAEGPPPHDGRGPEMWLSDPLYVQTAGDKLGGE